MAHTLITDAETNAGKPQRQALWKKVKDLDVDLDTRVGVLEKGLGFFDHFNWEPVQPAGGGGGSAQSFQGLLQDDAGTNKALYGTRWAHFNDLGDASSARNPPKPAFSVARLAVPGSINTYSSAVSYLNLRHDQITAPLKITWRCKMSADGLLLVGMREGFVDQTPNTLRAGCWVERVDATNWRFVVYNGATTNGPNFAKPTIGTWFELSFEFTSTPSLIGRLNGVDKTSGGITTNLPTAFALHAMASTFNAGGSSTANNLDLDRCDFSAQGIADAP